MANKNCILLKLLRLWKWKVTVLRCEKWPDTFEIFWQKVNLYSNVIGSLECHMWNTPIWLYPECKFLNFKSVISSFIYIIFLFLYFIKRGSSVTYCCIPSETKPRIICKDSFSLIFEFLECIFLETLCITNSVLPVFIWWILSFALVKVFYMMYFSGCPEGLPHLRFSVCGVAITVVAARVRQAG